jgi:murein DD-endopeptidase MepM/ murein hydrolase activator NlpD
MARNKNKNLPAAKSLICVLTIISIIFANFFIFEPKISRAADDVEVLNTKIVDRKKEIDKLQKEIDAFKENIKEQQQQAKTLKNQIAILENQIAKVNLDIESTQMRIEETNLEIQRLNLQIKETEKSISDRKDKIAEYIRLINKQDQASYLEIMLLNESFSDFFDQLKYTEDIHSNLKAALMKLKKNKQDLDIQKSNLDEKIKSEEKLKDEQTKQRADLGEKNNAQGMLLLQAKLTEKQYQSNLYKLQLEQQQINADIVTLEKQIRKKLEERQKAEKMKKLGPTRLSWPVDPGKGITAFFHDPDYPFRYIFEHPAVDVRIPQGSAIKAPEDGYVGRVKFAGDKTYAYIMLIHNDGLSTVFGHVSCVTVKEESFVSKGQTIGCSGGLPGSIGAGGMTTGAHLHFEVRLNGIPVNPLEYLPGV